MNTEAMNQLKREFTQNDEMIGNGADRESIADGAGIVASVAPLQLLDGQQVTAFETVFDRVVVLQVLRVPEPVPRAFGLTHRFTGQIHVRFPWPTQLAPKRANGRRSCTHSKLNSFEIQFSSIPVSC